MCYSLPLNLYGSIHYTWPQFHFACSISFQISYQPMQGWHSARMGYEPQGLFDPIVYEPNTDPRAQHYMENCGSAFIRTKHPNPCASYLEPLTTCWWNSCNDCEGNFVNLFGKTAAVCLFREEIYGLTWHRGKNNNKNQDKILRIDINYPSNLSILYK